MSAHGPADALRQRLAGAEGRPLLCLDFIGYARRVFGPEERQWHQGAPLLNLMRQAQQGIGADVVLFPLFEWMTQWWAANVGSLPAAGQPICALRTVCTHAGLTAALGDALAATATLNRPGVAVALSIADLSEWLAWAGSTELLEADTLEEGDGEDVAAYLSALLHQFPLQEVNAVFLWQGTPVDGSLAQACEPLTNTARHHGLATVLCAAAVNEAPEGFDFLANTTADGAAALLLSDGDWMSPKPMTTGRAFAVGRIPDAATPPQAIAALGVWRA